MAEIESVDDAVAVLRRHGITTGTQYEALRAAVGMPAPSVKLTYSRDELLGLCRDGFVPQEKWSGRDSARAQQQLGAAYALLLAGCDYSIRYDGKLETLWVRIEFRGFSWFEGGLDYDDRDMYLEHDEFYLPTPKRLEDNVGRDWY